MNSITGKTILEVFEHEAVRAFAFLETEYGFQRQPLTKEGLVGQIIYLHPEMGLRVVVLFDVHDVVLEVSIAPLEGPVRHHCTLSLIDELVRLRQSYASKKEWARYRRLRRAAYSDRETLHKFMRFEVEAEAFALRQGGMDLLRRFQECFGLTERQ